MTTAGRPQRIHFDPTKIKPPTLVTVYRLKYPGYQVVQRYYRYNFTDYEQEYNPYVDSCPGCGRELKYTHTEHKCPGTKLDNPVDTKVIPVKLTKRQQELEFKQYLSKQTHPIQLTE